MKFSTREDIDAPIEAVFEDLSDFEKFERQAMRRGVDVQRTGTKSKMGVGMTWEVSFRMRGRQREMTLIVDRYEAPGLLGIKATSASVDAVFLLELIALSRTRTRVIVGLELTPKNLSARLLVQSLKLAKGSLTKRFKLRMAEFARTTEERLQQKRAGNA